MAKKPGFFYYPADFDRDTRYCSLAATGAWIKMLNAMWFASTRGELTLPLVGYARLLGTPVDQAGVVLNELIDYGVCDAYLGDSRMEPLTVLPDELLHVTKSNKQVTQKITVVNRRISREENERKSTASRVSDYRKRREKQKSTGNVTPPSSISSSSSGTKVPQKETDVSFLPEHFAEVAPAWPDDARFLVDFLASEAGLPRFYGLYPDVPRASINTVFAEHRWWDALSQLFDGIDTQFLSREFASMDLWMRDNPKRKPMPTKRSLRQFVKNWLVKGYEQERKKQWPSKARLAP